MAEDVRVNVSVKTEGAQAAQQAYDLTGGRASLAERRAADQAAKAAQGNVAPLGFEGGGYTPDRIDRILNHLARWKMSEQQINELISQRKKDIETIYSKIITPKTQDAFNAYVRQGVSPRDAATVLNPKGMAEAEGLGRRYSGQINRMEAYNEDVKEGLYQAHERALGKWIPHLGRMFQQTLSLLGIGSVIGLLASGRSSAREFHIAATEGAMGLGMNVAGAREFTNAALGGPGAFGLSPMQRLAVSGRAIGGFGGKGGNVDRFAGLGLGFGKGREGFADMAAEMSMTAFTPDQAGQAGAERFGLATLGAGRSGGLTQVQKQFYLESNRSLIEMFTRMHGGKPLNAEEFVGHMEMLRQAVSQLGLVGGGLPMVRSMVEGAGQLVPMGKHTGDIYSTGMLLGISPEQASRQGGGNTALGFTEMIANLAKPENMGDLFRRIAKRGGVDLEPGQQATGEQMNRMRISAIEIFNNPKLAELMQTRGGTEAINAVLASGGSRPTNLTEAGMKALTEMERIMKETTGGKALSSDAEFIGKLISDYGTQIVNIESAIKQFLGPGGVILAALAASGGANLMGSLVGSFFGTSAGSAAGAAGGLAGKLGLPALMGLITRFGRPMALATLPFMLSGEGGGTSPKEMQVFREAPRRATKEEMEAAQQAIKKEGLGTATPDLGEPLLNRLFQQLIDGLSRLSNVNEDLIRNSAKDPWPDAPKRPLPKGNPGRVEY